MKSTSLRSVAAVAFAAVAWSSLPAGTILAPNADYTVDYTQTGDMTVFVPAGYGNVISFGHERVNGLASPSNNVVVATGALTATFQAADGKIFDRLYFSGMGGGAVYNDQGAGRAWIDWTVNGGTFEGGSTYGGANDGRGYAREWTITGPSTGSSFLYDGYWFQTVYSDFNSPVYGSAYYSIGASSFSIDISAFIQVFNQGGYWASAIDPQGIGFSVSFIDAPTTSSVPDAGHTAGLMLLALAGLMSARKRAGSARV